jgi:predicted regulator of Ras-like GTPase activity (Roadblock/LC7/MglB family)
LFGDLGAARDRIDPPFSGDDHPDAGFAATAIMESVATEVNARGQMVDRYSQDLVVSGSPAQAIREHFAATRPDLDTATSLITLLDPVNVWASVVIKALSDAGGRPIERLHLREHPTLRTLATIERTTLVRRHEDTLRIYHADVRVPGSDNAEIPVALMERSQMTTVIIGPLQPHSIDALLDTLHEVTALPTWRCPNLLFLLPPNAVWIANKISAIVWPARLHVHVLSESMTGASAVWNAMLGVWNHLKSQPGWAPDAGSRSTLDPDRAQLALAGMLAVDGLLGCAVVDSTTGLVLARETRGDASVDMDVSAAACAQLLRTHRQAARSMGLSEPIDEVVSSAGTRQQVIRTVASHPELFLVALLDKEHANLALARYQLMELERGLT